MCNWQTTVNVILIKKEGPFFWNDCTKNDTETDMIEPAFHTLGMFLLYILYYPNI